MDATPKPSFVDVHTHVVPSGDDGAGSLDEATELCRAAAAAGTGMLFATPHMHAPFDQYPWSEQRAELFTTSFEALRQIALELGVDLRRGREVYPTAVHGVSLETLVLEGTTAILLEFPGAWLDIDDAIEITWDACEHVSRGGYVPVLAHPERCPAVRDVPVVAERFAEQGWLLCPNAGSFLGDHGPAAERAAWELLDRGVVSIIASDAHHSRRPPRLDRVHDAIALHAGADLARSLLDGSALPWVGTPPHSAMATGPIRHA